MRSNRKKAAILVVFLLLLSAPMCRASFVYLSRSRIERQVQELRQEAELQGKSINEIQRLVDRLRNKYKARENDGTKKDNSDHR